MPLDSNVMSLGAGYLYTAPTGTVEPANLTDPWDAAWKQIGYTEDGHLFNYELTVEGIMVAEVTGPVRSETTERKIGVEFAMAEITATNLIRAMNGGTAVTGSGIVTVEPPTLTTSPTQVMLGWESFATVLNGVEERIVWRKCVQAKAFGISRKKPPAYATIPVGFQVLEASGVAPFKHIFDDSRA
jgi:hypothetical protein